MNSPMVLPAAQWVPWHLLVVVLGGGLGGVARYWVSGIVARRVGEAFPWGIMTVNVTGALGIGALAGFLLSGALSEPMASLWAALAVGVLGSYTTVSSFSLQTLALARDREWSRALANVALSLVLCLSAAGLAMAGVCALLGA